jgi:hypothetical protein
MIGILVLILFGSVAGLFLYSAAFGAVWTIRGLTIGGTAGIGSYLVNGYTGMYAWLERGYAGDSWGGLLLLVGLLMISSVLLLNLAMTSGRTAVQ